MRIKNNIIFFRIIGYILIPEGQHISDSAFKPKALLTGHP